MKRKISKLLAATALIGTLGISVVACNNNDSTSKTKQSSVKKTVKDKASNTKNTARKSKIKLSQTEAINKFDKKYSDKKLKEIDLKLDGNKYFYEITGFDKDKEYEMTINATSGKEVKSSSEKLDLDERLQKGLDLDKVISRDQASEIAEKEVKNSTAKEWTLKMDQDKVIWDVTVESGSSKHEVEIDAITKKVIKSEKDD
ncbi:peptidase propeptide and YPEB domain protein [Lactobacillus paragasseri JV-V03]|uniref:Peptidase propeptide and YPEB domain protein n=1 Tax=Lactobacillus paragasseri JV-V03 TaxID=525326 RepID=A0AA87AM51_9LACO|nr:PepSY domain-containing protein [Lactobacillus paragasseri]EFJ69492.1 peptidase propeptide and YPEB domain protein [Lactobacillus paragasseri JV-V03]